MKETARTGVAKTPALFQTIYATAKLAIDEPKAYKSSSESRMLDLNSINTYENVAAANKQDIKKLELDLEAPAFSL